MTEMERMQNEAINNARAMYRRRTPMRTVQQTAESARQSVKNEEQLQSELPEIAEPQTVEPIQNESAVISDPLTALFKDKERALLILLIILLSEGGTEGDTGTDPGLLLALLYCAL